MLEDYEELKRNKLVREEILNNKKWIKEQYQNYEFSRDCQDSLNDLDHMTDLYLITINENIGALQEKILDEKV